MEELNINKILNREEKALNIKDILASFDQNKNNMLFKKGIYVYGDPGSGKTCFVTKGTRLQLLETMHTVQIFIQANRVLYQMGQLFLVIHFIKKGAVTTTVP